MSSYRILDNSSSSDNSLILFISHHLSSVTLPCNNICLFQLRSVALITSLVLTAFGSSSASHNLLISIFCHKVTILASFSITFVMCSSLFTLGNSCMFLFTVATEVPVFFAISLWDCVGSLIIYLIIFALFLILSHLSGLSFGFTSLTILEYVRK